MPASEMGMVVPASWFSIIKTASFVMSRPTRSRKPADRMLGAGAAYEQAYLHVTAVLALLAPMHCALRKGFFPSYPKFSFPRSVLVAL